VFLREIQRVIGANVYRQLASRIVHDEEQSICIRPADDVDRVVVSHGVHRRQSFVFYEIGLALAS
jgi:hypothetical protein